MMASTIDGIVSGISTKELIASMITLEAGPQTLLKNKKVTTDALVTALQALNTKVASLAEHAAKAAKTDSWNSVKATITQSGASGADGAVTVTQGATPGSISFRVDALASAQSSLVSLPATLGDPPTFTLNRGGESVAITAASNSMPDIVEAFNASGTGVKATLVLVDEFDHTGVPTGQTTQLLQLTSDKTGFDQSFTLDYHAESGTEGVTLDHLTQASSAQVTLFPGTGAERTRTSASNTFEGLMTGVNVTVSQKTAEGANPLQLTVSRDDAASKSLASGMVDNLNAILSDITSRTKSTSAKDADGNEILQPGVFGGNSAIRTLQQRLQAEGANPINGMVPADVGIVLGRDGTYTFDSEAFDKAMAADPDQARAALTGFAERLSGLATANSDPIDGVLTQEITSRKGVSDDLSTRIKSWDDRLAMRQEALLRQFTAMEKVLSQLQGQSTYLTNILASMNKSDS